MDEIIHELDDDNCHRLIVNGVPGEWYQANEIAVNGSFFGIFRGIGRAEFPAAFTITEAKALILTPSKDRK